ncbi:nitronate monooxygenase, partial [Mycobacterium ulcerans]
RGRSSHWAAGTGPVPAAAAGVVGRSTSRPRNSDSAGKTGSTAVQPGAKARELATYFVGQVVGSLDRVRPTRSVVLEMVEEFIDTIGRLERLAD